MAGRKALEVYLDLLSQFTNKLTYLNFLFIYIGENRTPQYTKLNPIDAILKYLPTKYNVPSNRYPRHLERRARVDEYTAWQHTNTRPHAAKVFIMEVRLPTDPLKVERALADLGDTLEKLENMFLKRQPFLCGDDISLADLLAVCELMQLRSGVRDILKDRPKLLSWKSPVGDSFDEVHTLLYRLWDRSNAKL
uniref:glutathione transferase n=1 Tax=Salmo trutta TaxID=8032 RepID=A0A674B7I0_SALTR